MRRPPGPNDQAMPAASHKRERRGDQVFGLQQIHRAEKHQAAQARSRQIGEIDAPERAVAFQKHAAEEHRAGEKRREVGEKYLEQLPLLRGVRDQEDRVEAELLDKEIGADRERPEQRERDAGGDQPVALEPILGDAHHRAGEAKAKHREADDQRAEMRPGADREDAHDVDLQRDHRAGGKTDGEIEREAPAPVENDVFIMDGRQRDRVGRGEAVIHEAVLSGAAR